MKTAATNDRNFRTFLLVAQLEAKAIGARIKRARDEAGLTQEQLADMASGFSKRSLQDYEAGTTIPYKHMQEIAALTGTAPEWLIHGDPEPIQEPADALDRVHDRLVAIEARVLELAGLLRATLEIEEEPGSDPAPDQSERGSASLP